MPHATYWDMPPQNPWEADAEPDEIIAERALSRIKMPVNAELCDEALLDWIYDHMATLPARLTEQD